MRLSGIDLASGIGDKDERSAPIFSPHLLQIIIEKEKFMKNCVYVNGAVERRRGRDEVGKEMRTIFHKIKLIKHFRMALKMK